MDGPTLGALPPFNTIGHRERTNVLQALKRPLSGYLGGSTPRGGYWTDRLETEWTDVFGCRYAIPCNSATSGLLAASMAAGIGPGDEVWTTPYSMSATAAVAKVLGAHVRFIDIEPIRYSLDPKLLSLRPPPKALIVTNLFGHPAYLAVLRCWCDDMKVVMIEDNAQSIYAKEGKHYAGTIGHMGVFSLNVHKHLQVGEGGVVCTMDEGYSRALRMAINHGELAPSGHTGLNLRMTEPTAAMACAQLARGPEIIKGRRRLGNILNDMTKNIPWMAASVTDIDCTHSYYVWSALVDNPARRRKLVHELNLRGFPMREGYSKLLTEVFKSPDKCPEAYRIEHEKIITFDVCDHDPKAHHIRRMREVVEYVAHAIDRRSEWISPDARSTTVSRPI